MAVLLEAIHIKRKTLFEFENAPFACLDSDITTHRSRWPDPGAPEDAQPSHQRGL